MSNVEIKSETVETEEREENPKENTASLRRLAAFAFALSPLLEKHSYLHLVWTHPHDNNPKAVHIVLGFYRCSPSVFNTRML